MFEFYLSSAALKSLLDKKEFLSVVGDGEEKIRNSLGRVVVDKSNKIQIKINSSDVSFYEFIKNHVSEENLRADVIAVNSIIETLKSKGSSPITKLKDVSDRLKVYVRENLYIPWVVKISDGSVWMMTGSRYDEGGTRNNPYVSISLVANSFNVKTDTRTESLRKESIMIYAEDLTRKNIVEVLLKKGFQFATKADVENHDAESVSFNTHRSKINEQFILNDAYVKRPEGRYNNTLTLPKGSKFINDETLVIRDVHDVLETYFETKNAEMNEDGTKWMARVPYQHDFYMFCLDNHEYYRLFENEIDLYKYNPDVIKNLVLPESHHDLIKVLSNEMFELNDDFIANKTGGNIVLCKGPAGVGKTLTSECYSEFNKKPLYRVHSGQLGVTAKEVEESLNRILNNIVRWGCVCLIDECDVFVGSRGDNINKNAIVSSFLRSLEYFNGLMFLTTNRADDIDDAIISRCIAVINYTNPKDDVIYKIWEVILKNYSVDFDADEIKKLISSLPNVSGRDIKNLCRLAIKFSDTESNLICVDHFRKASMFRGLEWVN